MKKHFRNFCVRGMTFAWTGPVILAVVWLCLERAGIVSMLTVNEAVLGIVSSAIMAFVAAGISIVYQIENIPKARHANTAIEIRDNIIAGAIPANIAV